MTNQSSGICGMASGCCQTFIGSALIVQASKAWKRLGWANLGPHRGTLQATFQAIHAHAIQHSLVNWTSTFPGRLKKTHGEWRACNLACLPNQLLHENCQNLWTKSYSEKLPTASCVVQHPNITKRSCGQRWPLPLPCCLVDKVLHSFDENSSLKESAGHFSQVAPVPFLRGVQVKSEWKQDSKVRVSSSLDMCVCAIVSLKFKCSCIETVMRSETSP